MKKRKKSRGWHEGDKNFQKPINCIVNEGIRIKNRNRSTLLNSKNEHYGPSVRRRVVEDLRECNLCGSRFKSEYTLKMHTGSNVKLATYHLIQWTIWIDTKIMNIVTETCDKIQTDIHCYILKKWKYQTNSTQLPHESRTSDLDLDSSEMV